MVDFVVKQQKLKMGTQSYPKHPPLEFEIMAYFEPDTICAGCQAEDRLRIIESDPETTYGFTGREQLSIQHALYVLSHIDEFEGIKSEKFSIHRCGKMVTISELMKARLGGFTWHEIDEVVSEGPAL